MSIIIVSIIMMLSSLWVGFYYYEYVKETWVAIPYITTCISICLTGFIIFVSDIAKRKDEAESKPN